MTRLTILILALVFVGCGDDTAKKGENNENPNNGSSNNGTSNNGSNTNNAQCSASDEDCTCVPTTCESNHCGDLDDGCGTTLDCGRCGGEETCSDNQCVEPFALIGDACMSDSDCIGADTRCTDHPNYFEGYCVKDGCDDDSACPTDTHCVAAAFSAGFCAPDCTLDSDCRGYGYACYDLDNNSVLECGASGTGSIPVGGPCEGVYECNGGIYSVCEQPDDGFGFGFPGGMCTEYCDDVAADETSTCPRGTICSTLSGTAGTGESGYCLDECQTDADCPRAEYSCQTYVDASGLSESGCAPI